MGQCMAVDASTTGAKTSDNAYKPGLDTIPEKEKGVSVDDNEPGIPNATDTNDESAYGMLTKDKNQRPSMMKSRRPSMLNPNPSLVVKRGSVGNVSVSDIMAQAQREAQMAMDVSMAIPASELISGQSAPDPKLWNPKMGTPAMKTGWARKQGHMYKSWKKRYFVLYEGILKYYDKYEETTEKPKGEKGAIRLKGYVFGIIGGGHKLYIQPTSESLERDKDLLLDFVDEDGYIPGEEMGEWEIALSQHILYSNNLDQPQ